MTGSALRGPVPAPAIAPSAADDAFPVPSEELRWRVTGARDPEEVFRRLGAVTLADQERALLLTGRTMADFSSVLDFGCGCGRVMRHMAGLADRVSLHGCDIDTDAVEWCSRHLPFATFVRNDGLPPLPYASGSFDLVVNHSVFTHLPEDYQDAWLQELHRVVCPGGYLVLSVAGPHAFGGLLQAWREWPADPSHLEEAMARQGFLYVADDAWQDTCFPDFYHSTFHDPGYVVRHWGRFLQVVAYLPRAALGYADIVLLRRDDAG